MRGSLWGLSGSLKSTVSRYCLPRSKKINSGISCGLRSKRDHSVVNNGTTCDSTFRQNSLTTCSITCHQIIIITRSVKSLDYALHSCFRKIISTRDQVVVYQCMAFFDFSSVSEAVKCKQHRFFQRYLMSTNFLCVLFCDKATAVI